VNATVRRVKMLLPQRLFSNSAKPQSSLGSHRIRHRTVATTPSEDVFFEDGPGVGATVHGFVSYSVTTVTLATAFVRGLSVLVANT
jgi:hypothetical protein